MKNSMCNEGIVLQIALRRCRAQWIKSAISFLVYSGEYVPSYSKLVLLKNRGKFYELSLIYKVFFFRKKKPSSWLWSFK